MNSQPYVWKEMDKPIYDERLMNRESKWSGKVRSMSYQS